MSGHIRQRSPGSFELRYFLGTDWQRVSENTRRRPSRDHARMPRRSCDAFSGRSTSASTSTRTGSRYGIGLLTWLEAVRQEVSPKTYERYGEIVNHFLAPALGSLLLAKLAPVHIQETYNALAHSGRRDGKSGGLAPRTRQHIHRILSSALARAVEQQLIARNPADIFRRRLPKVEHHTMTTLTAEQSAVLLDALRHSHIYWPVLISLATGVRRGEVLALRWRNVDLDHGTVRIVESLEQTKGGLRFKSPKTDRARAVALPAFATDELRRLKREQAERLFMLGVRQTGATLLCARADGEPLQPQSLTHEFPRFLARLGPDFPRVRFHDLRHSHATQLLLAGVHPKVAQERLGHSTITTTLDLYSHVTETMQEDAAARIDAAFRGAVIGGAKRNGVAE